MRRILLLVLVLLFAPGVLSGALGAPASSASLEGAMVRVELSDEVQEFSYTPAVNSLYGVYLLPETDGAHGCVQIELDGEEVASGEGALGVASLRMTAGAEYRLKLTGEGAVWLEVTREALSRSFSMPLELNDGDGYSKLIAREGDGHWYAITAEADGAAMLICAPETAGLRMQGMLFSSEGRFLAEAETLPSGTAVLSALFESGQTYYLRLSGYEGGMGKYTLSCMRSANTSRPESVHLSANTLEIDGFTSEPLSAEVYPPESCPLLYLDSANPRVAQGWDTGFVEGRSDGLTLITAYAFGGARSTCRVSVSEVPLEEVLPSATSISLTEGESCAMMVTLLPANTTQRRLVYASSDEDILTVDKSGVLTAVREGEAEITVSAADGAVSATISVQVDPAQPKYRALLVGEQEYASTVETVRTGSVKSVESLRSLLNSASFDGGGYSVSTLMDAPRDDVLAAIRQTFSSAREDDTSLLYITCHGFYRAGMTFFLMADGSVLSASDLERELRAIPGQIILLVDCCGSGGMLGEYSSSDDILRGVTDVFSGAVGPATVRGSKYSVIVSAYLDQDSHRIAFAEDDMATVFARALCDAAGWSMDHNAPSAMKADVDYDAHITLDELGAYLTRRVAWYLNLVGDYVQTVAVYPTDDPTIIFARTSE